MTIQKIISKSAASLQEANLVNNFSDRYIKQAAQDLLDTLEAQQKELDCLHPGMGGGVGLASNQIEYPYQPVSASDATPALGYYPKNFTAPWMYVVSIRLERARRENCDSVPPTVYVNARYETLSNNSTVEYAEGCLSIVGVQALKVPRDTAIRVTAQTINNKMITFEAKDFIARVHQHEQDHCHGQEYLNHLHFTLDDLEEIREWIDRNENKPTPQKGTVIIKDLICTGDSVDFKALNAWIASMALKSQSITMKSR